MRSEAPIWLATLYKGDIFGEMALFNDSPCAASANSHTETIRIAVKKKEFNHRFDNADPIIKSVMQYMMGRMHTISNNTNRMRKKLGPLSGAD